MVKLSEWDVSNMKYKSEQTKLQNRGFVTEKEIQDFNSLSKEELLELLDSENAAIRSAAAYHLSAVDEEVTRALLRRLLLEECLYTRLAICESLQKGNIHTAKQMLNYLGKIGDNQHKVLPKADSKKKSFPLPRDIIARTLGRMDVSVYPVLIDTIKGKDKNMISEALDAIGYMVFYHPELSIPQNAEPIYSLFKRYAENNLILWKALLCLSAFKLDKSYEVLLKFSTDDSVLGMEARRSLGLLDKR
jgi:FOG: HEAT repeat